jgi:tetratricopeptide (TPR) repeat protein
MPTSVRAVYAGQGRTDAAVDDFNQALKLKPNNPLTLMALSRVHEQRGELELAVRDVNGALGLQPNAADLLLARARLLYALRSPTRLDAEPVLDPFRQRRQGRARIYAGRGLIDKAQTTDAPAWPDPGCHRTPRALNCCVSRDVMRRRRLARALARAEGHRTGAPSGYPV